MQRWKIRDDRGWVRLAMGIAATSSWPDDRDTASLTYQGPHGPAFVAFSNGYTATRVWGPAIPEGEHADGPNLHNNPGANFDRLHAGVSGHIGGVELQVTMPEHGIRPSRQKIYAEVGGTVYTLRVRLPPV